MEVLAVGTVDVHTNVKLSQLYYYFRGAERCLGMRVAVQGKSDLCFLELQPLGDTAGPAIRLLGYPDTSAAFVLAPCYVIRPHVSGLIGATLHAPSFVAGHLALAESGCYIMASFGPHQCWVNANTGQTTTPILTEPVAVFGRWSVVRQGPDGEELEAIFDYGKP